MKIIFGFLFLISSLTLSANPLWLRYPAISPDGSKIVFSYQGDLFLVEAIGGKAQQLTSHSAHDYSPIWSHDSKTIAFSSNRHGNFDIYTTNANGGIPKRLTFHSSNDIPTDFSIDNNNVIFTSSRLDHPKSVQFPYARLNEMYQVSVEGGREKQLLTIPGEKMKYSTDGLSLIFQNKKGYENEWRKHHQSSVTRDIVTYNFNTKIFQQLTSWNGEDRDPLFGKANKFYFLSEKSGSFNIWQGSLNSEAYQNQITDFKDHPVRFLSRSNEDKLCFTYDGEIYINTNGISTKINIEIIKDNAVDNIKLLRVSKNASQYCLSPTNKEIAFIYRGDVFVTSIDYKTTKRITSTAAQERTLSFSPDGKTLIYASERNNSWSIYQTNRENSDEKYFFNSTILNESILVNNGNETFQPKFSPNCKEVAFLEDRTTIRAINLKTKKIRTILNGKYNYSYSDGDQNFTWSPDSKWILTNFFEFARWNTDVCLVNANGKEAPINLTRSGYSCYNPKFSMNGQMVYYSTNKYGFRSHGSWGAQSDVEAIFLTQTAFKKFTLNKEDYEFWKIDHKKDSATNHLQIEQENLFDRKIKLTIHSSRLMDFYINNDGTKLIYLSGFEKGYDLWQTKFKDKETKLVAKLGTYYSPIVVDSSEKNIYLNKKGALVKLDFNSFKSKPISIQAESSVNLAAERKYMFYHAWRQVREKFYVEDLHGVNWAKLQSDYAKFLPHINNSYDFVECLSEILGELNGSHTGARYKHYDPNGDQTANFGCYFDESYKGDGLKIVEIMGKSPLLNAKKRINNGVIIEAIDGVSIKSMDNYYPLLNRKVGKKILLTLFDPKSGEKWNELIKGISKGHQNSLAYLRWIKNCEKTVEELSSGQLGYVHIRGMNSSSFRELYDKALGKYHTKKALIIDTRFNGGGWLHDDLATFLSGKLYMEFVPRGQNNMGGEPISKWQKPSCVLMSEGNYSDAHLFPYTYRALGIGKLIGMPVAGTGTAVWWETMVDGKTIFGIPQIGMKGTEGYLVENHELEPDIKINNDYSKFINGEDQQLITAIDELLKE